MKTLTFAEVMEMDTENEMEKDIERLSYFLGESEDALSYFGIMVDMDNETVSIPNDLNIKKSILTIEMADSIADDSDSSTGPDEAHKIARENGIHDKVMEYVQALNDTTGDDSRYDYMVSHPLLILEILDL